VKPIVAIVGRPNVGKSTLFNRIIGERRAIVLDTPGVTRDRNYGDVWWEGRDFTVVDTGGFEPAVEHGVVARMREQAMLAIEEAEVVVFVMDAMAGPLPADYEVVELLRRSGRQVVYAVNKVDNPKRRDEMAEFYSLGVESLFPISAEHGLGVDDLVDAVAELLPEPEPLDEEAEERVARVALLGRPNVGKSTLANRLLGEDRMVVDSTPGTTRDAIDSPLRVGDREYLLIDTAGLRRRRGIDRMSAEGHSVMRTLRAIERCHVAVVLLDAIDGVTDQDARIVGLTEEKGRALVLVVNKWDAVEKDEKTTQKYMDELRLKLPFATYAPVLFISGLTGLRVHKLMELVDRVRDRHLFRATTGPLNRWLKECTERHSPPVVRGRRLKLYYATQTSIAPPTIMISCNYPDSVHFSYHRFLVNQFREAFDVEGTPIRLIFRARGERQEDE
jgi:GTP-binding protein